MSYTNYSQPSTVGIIKSIKSLQPMDQSIKKEHLHTELRMKQVVASLPPEKKIVWAGSCGEELVRATPHLQGNINIY